MNTFYLYRKAWRFDGAPHEEPELKKEEWKQLLKRGGLLVRNTFNFDCSEQTNFWNLIKDRFDGLEELSGNTRKKVRRSLEKLVCRQDAHQPVFHRIVPYPIGAKSYKFTINFIEYSPIIIFLFIT